MAIHTTVEVMVAMEAMVATEATEVMVAIEVMVAMEAVMAIITTIIMVTTTKDLNIFPEEMRKLIKTISFVMKCCYYYMLPKI